MTEMDKALQNQTDLFRKILSAISSYLQQTEVADIRSFIDAGEYGIAADTIFCAIADDDIHLDDNLLRDLSSIEHLYNTAGDLDPKTAMNVLAESRRPSPAL